MIKLIVVIATFIGIFLMMPVVWPGSMKIWFTFGIGFSPRILLGLGFAYAAWKGMKD